MAELAVGIDLGTSNSCVAILRNGQVEVLYRTVNQDGNEDRYNEDFDGLDTGLRLGSLTTEWHAIDSGLLDRAQGSIIRRDGKRHKYNDEDDGTLILHVNAKLEATTVNTEFVKTSFSMNYNDISSSYFVLTNAGDRVAENIKLESQQPVYVIGTDVPIPGGAKEHLSEIRITPVHEVEETIEVTKSAFYKLGLHDAWKRVLAVVVQPGVEFGDTAVIEYDRNKAALLSQFIEKFDNLTYEAHSTDYQTKDALRQMVEDHFRILKVGPWLTFAMRETFFALSMIEKELYSKTKDLHLSGLVATIEEQMCKFPKYWSAHYHGNESQLRLARKYSYSDRIRYYWPDQEIQKSLNKLIENLSKQEIPLNVLSQYLPLQYEAIREGRLQNQISDLIEFGITQVLDIYSYATEGRK